MSESDALVGLLFFAALAWGALRVAKAAGAGGSRISRGASGRKTLEYVPMAAADAMKARKASIFTGRIGDGPTVEEWHAGRSLQTRGGEMVRSPAEVRIANHLYKRGIPYEYEPMIQGFRPDFYLPEHGIVIEYWGMDERGSPHRRTKTRAYLSNGYALVSLEPGKDVPLERDLDRQLWHKIRGGAGASA